MRSTPDLCDDHADDVRVVTGLHWRSYGGRDRFGGPIATVKCFEDNSRVKETLATEGEGRVLVVDGGGSLRNALIGDMIAANARDNGWAGIVIHGACRDVDFILEIGFPVCFTHYTPVATSTSCAISTSACSPWAACRARACAATKARSISRSASAASPSARANTSTPMPTASSCPIKRWIERGFDGSTAASSEFQLQEGMPVMPVPASWKSGHSSGQ